MKTNFSLAQRTAFFLAVLGLITCSFNVHAAVPTQPEKNEMSLTSAGDNAPNDLIEQIEVRLNRNFHGVPKHSVYVHIYVNASGKIHVLEIYSPSEELKKWLRHELETTRFQVAAKDVGRHFEFTVSFRSA